jgi:hypothetical protein
LEAAVDLIIGIKLALVVLVGSVLDIAMAITSSAKRQALALG